MICYNFLFIFFSAQRRQGFEIFLGDQVLCSFFDDDIALEMEWIHICVTSSGSEQNLFINSKKVLLVECDGMSMKESGSQLTVALEGGGTLVLGQDQDKPGGGFDPSSSLSGAIADLQLFPMILNQKEVQILHQCHAIDIKPLLDLNNPN